MESPSCQCCHGNGKNNTCFDINLTHQGKSKIVTVSIATTGLDLHRQTLHAFFGLSSSSYDGNGDGDDGGNAHVDVDLTELKLLFKGKRISAEAKSFPFSTIDSNKNKKPPTIMVIATNQSIIQELSMKKSDPLMRGFDQEKDVIEKRKAATSAKKQHWGEGTSVQDQNFKFVRMKACTNQSFGHRSTEQTPHDFQALALLEKLATDPGIVAIMKERELVVNTLGEMDPIDDRIMQKAQQSGGVCLLGYNTNRGK